MQSFPFSFSNQSNAVAESHELSELIFNAPLLGGLCLTESYKNPFEEFALGKRKSVLQEVQDEKLEYFQAKRFCQENNGPSSMSFVDSMLVFEQPST